MKSPRFAYSVAGFLACGCVAGCEALVGIGNLTVGDAGVETSTGESGTGVPEAGTSDAPIGTADAPTNETGGGGDDGPATGDAPGTADSPGTTDSPGTGGGFCASRSPTPVFCQDFDGPGLLLPANFSGVSTTGGALTLTDASAASPPTSLSAQDNALSSGSLDTALRNFFSSLPSTATTFTFDFQIEPVSVDSAGSGVLVAASLDFADAANNRYSLQFTLFQQGVAGSVGIRLEEQAEFTDGGTYYQPHTLQSIRVGAWTEVTLKLDRSQAASPKATVDLNGSPVLNATALTMNVNPTTLTLTIGSAYESTPSTGWTTRYDNVALNF
jgi:hypothetical protein